jgi:cell shape-determining protein MreC
MRTKEWKGAIKHDKQKIAQLKKENQRLKHENLALRQPPTFVIPLKKWWQFWK